MSEEQPFDAIGEYLGELNRLMDASKEPKKSAYLLAAIIGSKYFMAILNSLVEIDSLHKEVRQILDDFGGRQAGFLKYMTIDHLILLVKFYVVQWATLSDMLALLINKTFNLGIGEKDITFGLVMRNQHIQQSEILGILKRHTKSLEYGRFNAHRNEIVHRGKIQDKDVLDLQIEWNRMHSSKYSFLVKVHITDEEYETASASLTEKTFSLAARKQTDFRDHYQKTLKMVAEMLRAMARKAIDLYEKGAV